MSGRLSAALGAANAGNCIERELGAGGMATAHFAHPVLCSLVVVANCFQMLLSKVPR